MARMAAALGVADAPGAPGALLALSRRLGIRSLKQLGFSDDDIPEAAGLIAAMSFPNPRPVDENGVRWILEHAL